MKKLIRIVLATLLFGSVSAVAETENPRVALETNRGTITLELNRQAAPGTVDNFLQYVESGYFSGTIFHRVIKGFMIQGGGLTTAMVRKKGLAVIRNEADNGLSNRRGTIAMARTPDPHSASSQFFINTKDNLSLDHSAKTSAGWGYCVFGKVVAGMAVVDAIEAAPTTSKAGRRDVPVEEIVIERVVVVP